MAEMIEQGCKKGRLNVLHPLETSCLLLALLASAHHMFYQNGELMELKNDDKNQRAFQDNMQRSLEDMLSRVLAIDDYKFALHIQDTNAGQ